MAPCRPRPRCRQKLPSRNPGLLSPLEEFVLVVVGLVLLVAALILGVAGVLANAGTAHALTHTFSVFGYHVTGSTGTLFLYGIVIGAIAMFGLSLLLAGARRTSRRGQDARRGLQRSRQETAAAVRDRDDLSDRRAPVGAEHRGRPADDS